MLLASFLASCAMLALVSGQASNVQPPVPVYPPPYPYGGSYCSRLPSSQTCCVGRRDDCSTPISTTRCYCDNFCNQHGPNRDCCPDYESFCNNVRPPPYILPGCPYDGINYDLEASVRLRDSCYSCVCKEVASGKYELQCEYVCSPKPSGICPYNSVNYPAGGYVNIGQSCYTCTCTRTWYSVTMHCVYTCSSSLPTPPPAPINKCYHNNRYLALHETVRGNCKICTCKETTSGFYDLSCYADPECAREGCHYNSQVYRVGSRIRMGLQECTCVELADTVAQFTCTDPPPPPTLDPVIKINTGSYGWTAYKYSFLVGRTMEEVFRLRTGVCRPETQVIYDLKFSEVEAGPTYLISYQKDTFDARTQWPGLVRPISDAGDHPISWAVTIADLASDRKAIQSLGKENLPLSAQNLIACVSHSESHCTSSARGWEYLNKYGIVSEECYPRNAHSSNTCQVNMGEHYKVTSCPSGRGHGVLLRLPRQHRISTQEWNIRNEVANNGPVQAHIRVKEDFFYYRSGVYRHVYGNLHNNNDYYLAVRIIGWGTDVSTGSPINYWICANSWGTGWGENGHFRIVRGVNECQVEEFVYAVWSPQSGGLSGLPNK